MSAGLDGRRGAVETRSQNLRTTVKWALRICMLSKSILNRVLYNIELSCVKPLLGPLFSKFLVLQI